MEAAAKMFKMFEQEDVILDSYSSIYMFQRAQVGKWCISISYLAAIQGTAVKVKTVKRLLLWSSKFIMGTLS